MKKVAVLGSTGSIGKSALDVIAASPDRFSVVSLSARSRVDIIEEQVRLFRPSLVALLDEDKAKELKGKISTKTKVVFGIDGLIAAATHPDVDVVVVGTSGHEVLVPLIRAIESGKKIALASKELLVMAGEIVMRLVSEKQTELVPIDSEHAALFQALRGVSRNEIERIFITGSGGSLWSYDASRINEASVEEVLRHPKWQMGPKITVDSASFMNKGLELIEAHWLFGLPIEKIKVLIHPQAVVHGIVELIDGSCIAHAGVCDMRLPIQYALSFPERWHVNLRRLVWNELPSLEFHEPDLKKFPCLALAMEAAASGGSACTVLSAANDIAVGAFLRGEVSFGTIPKVIEGVLSKHAVLKSPNLDEIIQADTWARTKAKEFLKSKKVSDVHLI
jgi:1-deoxy-D-xylulose-5-phosphate reductoisomerase